MASTPIVTGSQQDFKKIPVIGLVAENSGTAPTSPVNGQTYYDSALLRHRVFENGAWQNASLAGAELVTNKGAANGYAPLNASSQVPLANLPVASSGTNSATALVRADDSRLADQRVPTDDSVTGGTTGAGVKIKANTITAANIVNATITDVQVAAANKDGAIGVASLRTLGTGAQQALAGNTRLDQLAIPTASVSFNGQKITGLADGTNPTDAVTRQQLDAVASGLDVKASVRAASTSGGVAGVTYNATGGTTGRGQITTAPNALDGVTLAAGNRILLKDQSTGAQNGIWVVTTLGTGANGVWDRATDFDQDAEVTSGAFTFVEEGTANDNSGWVLTTNNPITIGGASGTALAFAQFSGAGSISAGNGLTQTGNSIDVVGTANRISVAADSIDIAATYVGQTSITTVGTIATGTWQGTAVGVGFGGTGANTAALARTNLGAVGKASATLAALVAGTETQYAHGLGTTTPQVQFQDAVTSQEIRLAWRAVDANTIGVTADTAFAVNAVRANVQG